MGAQEGAAAWCPGPAFGRLLALLALALALLSQAGYADDLDFNLEDALDDDVLSTKRPTHKPPKTPSGGTGDFDLPDPFDTPPERTTKPAKATTGPYPRKPDDGRWNVLHTTTTKQPKTTKPPPKKTPAKDPMDFDLSDALDDQNDGRDGGMPNVNPGGRGSKGSEGRGGRPGKGSRMGSQLTFLHSLCKPLVFCPLSPSKHLESHPVCPACWGFPSSAANCPLLINITPPFPLGFSLFLRHFLYILVGCTPEQDPFRLKHHTVELKYFRAVTFILVGCTPEQDPFRLKHHTLAYNHYIGRSCDLIDSLCRSLLISEGLNAEYVKGENMEAVVTEEPQVKYSVLEPQTAEAPPPQENAKV
nr:CD99 antigen-like protein 2 [Anolis sagrei ordinatus]